MRHSYYDDDNDKHVRFTEGIFLGYRGYDRNKTQVQYPFGYGLSYTTFELSDMEVCSINADDATFEVSFNIKNTGKTAGAEVVQLYVGKVGGISRATRSTRTEKLRENLSRTG